MCEIPAERIVFQHKWAMAFYDVYPVSDGHGLVIPKRHVVDFWGPTAVERGACHDLLEALRKSVQQRGLLVTGSTFASTPELPLDKPSFIATFT